VFVDATYCKARVNRRVVAQAVVVATGVCGDGRREVLGFAVGDSEDGAFWTAFLRSLKARGLTGVQLVIADTHLGLRQAVSAVMAGAAIQRCRVHFLRNVLASVPRGRRRWSRPPFGRASSANRWDTPSGRMGLEPSGARLKT
jgi:putative transposase